MVVYFAPLAHDGALPIMARRFPQHPDCARSRGAGQVAAGVSTVAYSDHACTDAYNMKNQLSVDHTVHSGGGVRRHLLP